MKPSRLNFFARCALLTLLLSFYAAACGDHASPLGQKGRALCRSTAPATRSQPAILFTMRQIPQEDPSDPHEHPMPGPYTVYATSLDGAHVWRIARDAYSENASPDGRRAVVGLTGQRSGLRVLDLRGNCRRRLGGESATSPAWSPDGRKIAFAGEFRLFVADDAGRVTPLGPKYSEHPAWSPDGSRLAFLTVGEKSELSLMDAAGGNVRRLAAAASDPAVAPVWLRDGKSIIFFDSNKKLSLISLPRGTITRLPVRIPYDYRGVQLERSPTSDTLALADSTGALVVIDPSRSSTLRRIAKHVEQVEWSLDGRRILLSRRRQVWIVNRDGTGLRQITHCPRSLGDCGSPVWVSRTPSRFPTVRWPDVD